MNPEWKQEIKNLFKGYSRMNTSIRKKLHKMGFLLEERSKHYVLLKESTPSFRVTISKTPSDTRSGMNIAANIIQGLMITA